MRLYLNWIYRSAVVVFVLACLASGCDFVSGGGSLPSAGRLTGGGGLFGRLVSIDGRFAAVGAQYDGAGAIFPYRRSGHQWQRITKITPEGIDPEDTYFGSLELEDRWLVAGYAGDISGDVLVYRRNDNSSWNEFDHLRGDTGATSFGSATDLAGEHLLVGAPRANVSGPSSGAAYLYTLDGGEWTQSRVLSAPGETPGATAGGTVELVGPYALVGDHYVESENGPDQNMVLSFCMAGSNRMEPTRIRDPRPSTQSFAEDIESYGNWVAISSPSDTQSRKGAVDLFRFERSEAGECRPDGIDLTPVRRLEGSEPRGHFGGDISMSEGHLIVGVPFVDEGRGAARTYRHTRSGWTEVERLTIPDVSSNASFGRAVGISEGQAIVGLPGSRGEDGAAYIFNWEEGEWTRK